MEKEVISLLTRIATALETIAQNTSSSAFAAGSQQTMENGGKALALLTPTEINQQALETDKRLSGDEIKDRRNIIFNFFENKNIAIEDYSIFENDQMKQVSMYIGEKFESIKDFWNLLKRSVNGGCTNSSIDLSFANDKKLSNVCQIASLLYDNGYLSERKYYKSPVRRLDFKVSDNSEARKYILGEWFEIYLLSKVIESVGLLMDRIGKIISYSYLSNVKVVFNGGKHAEFDLVFEIAGKIFILEAKTHNLDKSTALDVLRKNNDYAKFLGLNSKNAFVIHTHPDNYYINTIKSDCGNLSVISIEEFRENFTELLMEGLKNR